MQNETLQSISKKIIQDDEPLSIAYHLIYGFIKTKVFGLAVELDLANHIDVNEMKHYTVLAKEVGVDPQLLYRLMRTLASSSVFHEVQQKEFQPTSEHPNFQNGLFNHSPTSLLLRGRNGIKDLVLLYSTPFFQRPLETLGDTIKSGKSSTLKQTIGYNSFWEYTQNNPKDDIIFNNAMTGQTLKLCSSLVQDSDFSSFETVVDLGGGKGLFLTEILKQNPHLKKGINFDLPLVVGISTPSDPRLENHGGSFFESVPESDCYVMKLILHDWDDDHCLKILNTISKSIKPKGKIYIYDFVYSHDVKNEIAPYADILLLQLCNGKERSIEEWDSLAQQSGQFKLEKVIEHGIIQSLIIFEKI